MSYQLLVEGVVGCMSVTATRSMLVDVAGHAVEFHDLGQSRDELSELAIQAEE